MNRSAPRDPVRIRDWYLRAPKLSNPFLAPELLGVAIAGEVHGHPRKANGTRVTTSRIVRVEGRRVWTESGTEYLLDGEPRAQYLEWLKARGHAYDPQQPIKLVGGRSDG